MGDVYVMDPTICNSPNTFARSLRMLADSIEAGNFGGGSPIKTLLVLSKHEDGEGIRISSYGAKDLTMLEVIGVLEFGKLTAFDLIGK